MKKLSIITKLKMLRFFNKFALSFPFLARGIFSFINILVSPGKKVVLKKDDQFYVESKLSAHKMLFAYPSRSVSYIKGVDSYLVNYKYRYGLPEFTKDESLIVIDCGCNIGEFARSFLLSYPNSYIYLFEPSPLEFMILQENLNQYSSQVNFSNSALGEHSGSIDFFLKSEEADSTTIEPLYYDEKINVPIISLDKFFTDDDLPIIDLIKLEAEGAEPEVLQGASSTLQRTRYVTVDWGPERGILEKTTIAQICNILFSLGFEMELMSEKSYTCLFKNTLIS